MDKKHDTQALMSQYTTIVDLYKHEDLLNWTKFEHLVYVNAGLWIVVNFLFSNSDSISGTVMTVIFITICILGFVASMAFAGALWSGVNYMNARKDSVRRIERALIDQGSAVRVFCPDEDCEVNTSTPSLTSYILRYIPFLLALIWLVMIVMEFVIGIANSIG